MGYLNMGECTIWDIKILFSVDFMKPKKENKFNTILRIF